MLDYGQVVERLTYPVKFGLKLSGQGQLVRYLALLQGSDFQRVERYRNLKIHKREPRIEIYGVEPHHDWSYMVPLTDPKEIAAWKAGLARQYPDPTHRRLVERGCYIRGVLFDQKTLRGRLWSFNDIRRDWESCLLKLLRASAGCFHILKSRRPIKRSRRRRH